MTNSYRSDGGGRFPGLDGSTAILRAPDLNRDAIARYLETQGRLTTPTPPTWRFLRPAPKLALSFRLSPRLGPLAKGHEIQPGATSADGYVSDILTLG